MFFYVSYNKNITKIKFATFVLLCRKSRTFPQKISSKNLVSTKIVIFRKSVYGSILSIISFLLLLLLFADLIKLEYMNVIDTKFPPNCKIIPAPFVVLGLKWFQQIVGFIASVHLKIHIIFF